jgi:hypothetical protein
VHPALIKGIFCKTNEKLLQQELDEIGMAELLRLSTALSLAGVTN